MTTAPTAAVDVVHANASPGNEADPSTLTAEDVYNANGRPGWMLPLLGSMSAEHAQNSLDLPRRTLAAYRKRALEDGHTPAYG